MIRGEHLHFFVGQFQLEDANFEVGDGEYFVLLGPPGSGKSVLMECLCGLNRVQRGRVLIDGRDVTDWEPRRRAIGYVPQDYALFPHLSVKRNIESGLRARRLDSASIRQRTVAVAQLLGIAHLLDRPIVGLSGGEKQRTALARALAIEPRVLLLDEPVSALDESTREQVCGELRQLQRALNITTIHISHNLEEAFSVADRGGVLFEGRFQQIGALEDLLRRPASPFVARFMRCQNILTGRCDGLGPAQTTRVVAQDTQFYLPGAHEGEVQFIIRPENLQLVPSSDAAARPQDAVLPVRVERTIDLGSHVRLHLNGAIPLVAHLSHPAITELKRHDEAGLLAVIRPEAIHILTCDG